MGQMLRLALLILLVSAAPASAQWSPPTAISGAGENFRPHVAFSPAGERLNAWTRFRGDRASILASGLGRLTRDGDQLTGPVGFGARSFALAWTNGRRTRLHLRVRKQRRTVARGRRISSPVLAGNADGRLALAWFEDRGTREDVVMVALRRRSGGYARPVRLARERVRSVTVAVGERGQVLVAWDAFGKVRTRLRRGSRFGRTDTIRSFQAFNAKLQAAVAANGRAIVGWTAKFRSEGGTAGPTYQQVAVRPAGGGRFRRAQMLSQTPDAPDAEGTLKLDVSGEPQVAWTQEDGIFRSRPDAEGVFGAGETIAPAGSVLQDLVGGIAFWTFGRELIADGAPVSTPGATQADAAIDPVTGRPSVVWLQDGRVMTSTRG
jgi:hypothetical protein